MCSSDLVPTSVVDSRSPHGSPRLEIAGGAVVRGACTIRYTLPEPAANVTITLFDVRGRVVHEGGFAHVDRGAHAARLFLGGTAAGVYTLRLQAGAFVALQSLVLIR